MRYRAVYFLPLSAEQLLELPDEIGVLGGAVFKLRILIGLIEPLAVLLLGGLVMKGM